MLKEYITHIVRSLEACGPLTRKDLSEIMSITEDEFQEIFGNPAVSPKLSMDHVEALTRFFGGDLFREAFITQVSSYQDCSGVLSRKSVVTNETTTKLSTTANQMLRGSTSTYGNRGSASAATAIAAVRGFSSMIEGCVNLADIVGFCQEASEQQNTEDRDEGGQTNEEQEANEQHEVVGA